MINNRNLMKKLIEHQHNPMVHPLTCGNDSNHYNLNPQLESLSPGMERVVLKCLDCGYIQEYIPEYFTKDYP